MWHTYLSQMHNGSEGLVQVDLHNDMDVLRSTKMFQCLVCKKKVDRKLGIKNQFKVQPCKKQRYAAYIYTSNLRIMDRRPDENDTNAFKFLMNLLGFVYVSNAGNIYRY